MIFHLFKLNWILIANPYIEYHFIIVLIFICLTILCVITLAGYMRSGTSYAFPQKWPWGNNRSYQWLSTTKNWLECHTTSGSQSSIIKGGAIGRQGSPIPQNSGSKIVLYWIYDTLSIPAAKYSCHDYDIGFFISCYWSKVQTKGLYSHHNLDRSVYPVQGHQRPWLTKKHIDGWHWSIGIFRRMEVRYRDSSKRNDEELWNQSGVPQNYDR